MISRISRPSEYNKTIHYFSISGLGLKQWGAQNWYLHHILLLSSLVDIRRLKSKASV